MPFDLEQTYAHSPSNGGWHLLHDHLINVAEQARKMAEPFNLGNPAFWLGLIHDIGKANPVFQEYLRNITEGKRVESEPHAIWGASLIYALISTGTEEGNGWERYSLPAMGHHSGIPDRDEAALKMSDFLKRREDAIYLTKEYLKSLAEHVSNMDEVLPDLYIGTHERVVLKEEFTIRMLFSTLVDADYLDTESHFRGKTSELRRKWPELESLARRFNRNYENHIRSFKKGLNKEVREAREYVFDCCRNSSTEKSGIFTLTAPTGSGKTLGYLKFALDHALKHEKSRIIIVLPYTSIIDQTAATVRDLLGEDAVLEHQSSFDITQLESDEQLDRYLLAVENWDAPIIITTTAQFFESIFSNKPGKARKIHNIANSVVVLDEVQALPPELLDPTRDVIDTLVEEYSVSIVLSTATQPSVFKDVGEMSNAYTSLNAKEIITDYDRVFSTLKRVDYEKIEGETSWNDLVDVAQKLDQLMVVFNTRFQALKLYEMLKDLGDTYHMSSLLCPEHRKAILKAVKTKLECGMPVRLISTQVVEAGVDIDFPEVWRALGPLDRIVQVAGRCNRNGKKKKGRVLIFEPEGGATPRGPYKVGIEKSKILLNKYDVNELHYPNIYREYFALLHSSINGDIFNIQTLRKEMRFGEVSKRYRLIKDETVAVVVPYKDSAQRLKEFLSYPSRETWLGLQPFVVNMSKQEITRNEIYLHEIKAGLYEWLGSYDDAGISALNKDPIDLII